MSDVVGPNSLHFLDALGIDTQFFGEPIDTWEQIPPFLKLHAFWNALSVARSFTQTLIQKENQGSRRNFNWYTMHLPGFLIALDSGLSENGSGL